MELKVWVDNIKRVVCGVTDNTTCQDIVIALAHAMGRTGRFTLIEKWRDNERPLSPSECPLRVLQKWGEFATEVKFCLYESNKNKPSKPEKHRVVQKTQDRFTHNFTPPVKASEATIKRSLTFSGGRKSDSDNSRQNIQQQNLQVPNGSRTGRTLGSHLNGPAVHSGPNTNGPLANGPSMSGPSSLPNGPLHLHNGPLPNGDIPHYATNRPSKSQVTVVDTNSASSSSVPSHTSALQLPLQHKPSGSAHDRLHPSSRPETLPHSDQSRPSQSTTQHHLPRESLQDISHNSIPSVQTNQNVRKIPHVQNHPDRLKPGVTSFNPHNKTSAFSQVRPRRNSQEGEVLRLPATDIPVFTESINKSSHRPEVEEYDLDSNFPDVVKETNRDYLIEEYHVPGRPGQGQSNRGEGGSREEREKLKLLRLVSMQTERIKMQDSQLDIIDTEISSREVTQEEIEDELRSTSEAMFHFTNTEHDLAEELARLDNGRWIQDMENEKKSEKEIKVDINSLKTRLEKCEKNLHQFQTKVTLCAEELEKEKLVVESDEKRRKEEEMKLQKEISELQKDLDERLKQLESTADSGNEVEQDLKVLEEELAEKSDELLELEKEIQKENMKFFQIPQQEQETTGEAVIKVLERSVSPHLIKRNKAITTQAIQNLVKTKNGVWV